MKRWGRAIVFLAVFFGSSVAFATTTQFTAFDFWPATGRSDYFSIQNSKTLLQWQPHFGMTGTFAWKPVQFLTAAGAGAGSFIDYYGIDFLQASLGLTDWLQLSTTLPVVVVNKFTDPNVVGATPANEWFDLGDLRAAVKFRLIDVERHGVGVAVEPFMTAPTGSAAHNVGESKVTGGGKILVDYQPTERLQVTLNAGGEFRENMFFSAGYNYKERFLAGLGARYSLNSEWDVFTETTATTPFRHFFSQRSTTPTEVDAGLRWRLPDSGLTLAAGGGTCLICKAKGPVARGVLGIDYTLGAISRRPEKSVKMVKAPLQLEPVAFEAGRSDISESAVSALGRIADVLRASSKSLTVEVQGNEDKIRRIIRYLRYRGVPDTIQLTPVPKEGLVANRVIHFVILP